MRALQVWGIFFGTIGLCWAGWNTAVALGVSWQRLGVDEALVGGSLMWLMFCGFQFAMRPEDR